jgi:fungalysin metallopeptidase (M36)/PA domain-containing protein
MVINFRSLFVGSVAFLLSCADPSSPTDPATAEKPQPIAAAISLGATPLAVDGHGIPHLLRGTDAMPAMPAADATTSARMHVERLAPAWGVRGTAMPELTGLGEVPVRGGTIVKLRQLIDGMPVASTAGGEVHVMVRADGSLVGASGTLLPTDLARAPATFVDTEAGAVIRAVNDRYGTSFAPTMLARASFAAGGSQLLSGQAGAINVSMSRARQAWIPDGKALIPAWIVEAYSSTMNTTDGDAYRTVISASGKVISRTDLKADVGFKYRVFAETTGEFHPFDGPIVDSSPNVTGVPLTTAFPAFVLPNLVTVDGTNHPGGSNTPDSWLGSTATETLGNNVETYTDINAPDGLSFGDFRATATTKPQSTPTVIVGAFDRTYDTLLGATDTTDQQMAGITSLFYILNWMHDFWYDGGFTEAAGNGQNSNLGRGGEDRDAMLGEAQDNAKGGSRNNANMSTPSDGFPGRMQVFVWDNLDHRKLTVEAVDTASGAASFGSAHFTTTAALVLADDATAPATDACSALTAAASGKIVLADRGTCSFKTKALNAQTAGAVGLIIANNVAGTTPPGLADDATIMTPITIGTVSVTQGDGALLKTQIAAGVVNATMTRNLEPDLEGTLDATVIAHEFGHFVHHRLSDCNTTLCGAMSEGWADFSSLLVMSRAGDNLDKGFPAAIYSTRGISKDAVYYGIRRAPYSTNMALNPLMFRHMANGEPLPPPPFNAGDPNNNAEVHNGGEVWASMLWDGYVALQKAGTSFEDTRLKMRQYVVAGLLMAPPDATPTETRDAILLAVKAASPADHDLLAAAYARRGFGSCAISPPRGSATFKGIVESTEMKGRIGVAELDLSRSASCDNDDVLDAGESMQIKVPITNPGVAPMHGVTATLTSAISAIHITTPTVKIGTIDPDGEASATFTVDLDSTLKAPTESDLVIQLNSDDGCGPITVPVAVRFNSDDKPNSSATDDFNAGSSVWTASHQGGGADELWSHVRGTQLDGQWFGVDLGGPSDASLTSPPIKAGGDAVTVTFKHAFGFEIGAAPEQPFDGGVIEYTTDAGVTWQDVSGISTPGYNKLLVGDPATSGNPLSGRMAYGGTNKSFPNFDTVMLNFGTNLSGKTFQLRFRLGSDSNTGGPGWLIDDVAFTGITGTPFPTLVADTGHCDPVVGPKKTDDGGCCQAGGLGTGNLAAALGVLGLLLRRRRRC